jgi:hypothetical protein
MLSCDNKKIYEEKLKKKFKKRINTDHKGQKIKKAFGNFI